MIIHGSLLSRTLCDCPRPAFHDSRLIFYAGLTDPGEPDAHDHADATACHCVSPAVRTRLLGEGSVDAQALHELCGAPPLFLAWFFRRLGFLRPVAECASHPDVPLRPTVTGDGRVIYRYVELVWVLEVYGGPAHLIIARTPNDAAIQVPKPRVYGKPEA